MFRIKLDTKKMNWKMKQDPEFVNEKWGFSYNVKRTLKTRRAKHTKKKKNGSNSKANGRKRTIKKVQLKAKFFK